MKFKVELLMGIEDDYILDNINHYRKFHNKPLYKTIKEVPEEVILDSVYEDHNLDDFINYDSMLERIEVWK